MVTRDSTFSFTASESLAFSADPGEWLLVSTIF